MNIQFFDMHQHVAQVKLMSAAKVQWAAWFVANAKQLQQTLQCPSSKEGCLFVKDRPTADCSLIGDACSSFSVWELRLEGQTKVVQPDPRCWFGKPAKTKSLERLVPGLIPKSMSPFLKLIPQLLLTLDISVFLAFDTWLFMFGSLSSPGDQKRRRVCQI